MISVARKFCDFCDCGGFTGGGAFAGGNTAAGGFAGGFGGPVKGFANNVVIGNQVNANGNADAANAMMIQNVKELKPRMVDQPEMVKMVDSQILMLKQP